MAFFSSHKIHDLVILGWNRQPADHVSAGGHRVQYMLNHVKAPLGTLILHVRWKNWSVYINHTSPLVHTGIFVDKGRLRDRTTVERILFVYSFQSFEKHAFKLALVMAQNPDVVVNVLIPQSDLVAARKKDEDYQRRVKKRRK